MERLYTVQYLYCYVCFLCKKIKYSYTFICMDVKIVHIQNSKYFWAEKQTQKFRYIPFAPLLGV